MTPGRDGALVGSVVVSAILLMSNPYEAPFRAAPQRKEPGPLPPPQAPGLAGQIRIIAVLMIVQGFFEIAYGGMLTIMAFVFPAALAAMVAADPQVQAEGLPDPDSTARMMMVIYLVMGVTGIIPGLLHLAAGFRNIQYRGRSLGIAALGLGLATFPGVLCLPTALILGIYGMVVYLHASSAKVFEMGEQGYSAEAIYATFFAGRTPAAPPDSGAAV